MEQIVKKELYHIYNVCTWYCPHCFAEVQDGDANFCTQCRHDLRELQTVCKKCGTGRHLWMQDERDPNRDKCCPVCGTTYEHFTHPELFPALSFDYVAVPVSMI